MSDPTTALARLVEAIDEGTLSGAQRVRLSSLLDVIDTFARQELPIEVEQRDMRCAAQWEEVAHWYSRLLAADEPADESDESDEQRLERLQREARAATAQLDRVATEIQQLRQRRQHAVGES